MPIYRIETPYRITVKWKIERPTPMSPEGTWSYGELIGFYPNIPMGKEAELRGVIIRDDKKFVTVKIADLFFNWR